MTTHFKTALLVVGVSLGIAIGYSTQYGSEIAIAGILLAAGQMIVYVVGRKRDTVGVALSLATVLFSFGLVVGIVRVQLVEEEIPYTCIASCSFDARIVSSPETKDTYQLIAVRPIDSTENVFDVQIRVPLYPRYEIGESVRVSGKVNIPEIIPPHSAQKSFDYGAYLATKNIGSEMMFPKVEVLDSGAHSATEYLGRWKEDLIARENRFVSSPASTLATGMLFGNSGMSKELTQTFRVAGLSHIIVLSGFNIAIVIASILFVFAFLPLVLRITLASVFVILFVMMVGAEASVMRATAMAFIGLLATLIGRAYVARQALLISFLAIILYSPETLLHDVSLHLSFLATAGIIYLSEPLQNIIKKYTERKSLVELSSTTLAAYFATLPYVMYIFGTVSPYALIANMIALPLVPLAMLLSFSVVCMSYISNTLAMFVGYADTLLLNCILFIAHAIEMLPFSYATLSVSFAGMCLLYIFFLILITYMKHRKENETFVTTESGYLTGIIKY
jgi:competence protein ComEC